MPSYVLTFLLVFMDGFDLGVGDVLERSQEENHVSLFVLNWHDVQQAPEQRR